MGFPIEVTGRLVIDYRAREWCRLPYPDHPKGCPNFDHKLICPPQVCLIEEFVDLDHSLWLVVESFDLQEHVERMKARHSGWSDRQARNVLYWQGSVNKKLRLACESHVKTVGGVWTICPEAMGVNVIQTAKQVGLPIKARPTSLVFKIGLVGFQLRSKV
ncbi:hypothetical protein LCGC14_0510310 [marine sediment metagenome]|uniref:DUF2284 domain-containing protein n=1 Tax=marine sediment metagenome TaxID=412755 RepID=A0A0F9S1J9_9ZZZZ